MFINFEVQQFSAPDRKSRAVFRISGILCKTLHLPILSLAFPAGDFHVIFSTSKPKKHDGFL